MDDPVATTLKRFLTFSILAVLIGGIYLFSSVMMEFLVDYNKAKDKFLNNSVVGYFIKERQKVYNKAKLATLSYYIPNFKSLRIYIQRGEDVSAVEAERYLSYY